MDYSLSAEENARVTGVLERFCVEGVAYHALRTRQAGHRRFVNFHLLVPGAWTVERGHELLEQIEAAIREAIPHANVLGHLEPVEHPSSYADMELDR
jgi:divalent metal cation (Fe/Co/Zn/Cd) transporter